ncbi:MAG: hypothetical protein A2144_14620 [Chloroflexi bacterium RBG_16_50_9]|nr:MAG: hypothetical protein A2144_14620 [Chloroflexi bacterium RBG_16_50_9]
MTFEQMKSKAVAERKALEESEKPRIYIGTGTCGRISGAQEILEGFNAELAKQKVDASIIEVGCTGCCHLEPVVDIVKKGRSRIRYGRVTPEIMAQLVTDYIVNDNPRPDLALGSEGAGKIEGIPDLMKLPMFQPQVRIALRNCGYIDPMYIEDYVANGGYSGFVRALGMTPEAVIEEVRKSGLRGRGGAGFPTGDKWRVCHDAPGNEKYIICNAHESDPGSLVGRALLEGDPHSVLEGILIGAYAVGANQGDIYVRAEYELAIARIKAALKQMGANGLLGNNILGSKFSLNIEVREGASDFICGEETAMIRAMEGERGMSYPRPPYPAISGLGGKPTVVNNVETLSDVSAIFQKSAEWYTGYGTEQSHGTRTFALGGSIMRPGLIEVPMNVTLRQIIYDIGGGVPDNHDFKAVQTGGPSGGWLPASALDLPVDYENLVTAGSIMGSGCLTVADSRACMVDLAKNSVSFLEAESCGVCVLCREGTSQMLEILTDITEGRGKAEDMELLVELGEGLKIGSLCGLGKTAANPVLTTLKYFRDEYEAHINNKRCPAKVCQKLSS